MAPEALDDVGRHLAHGVQGVPQVHAFNGSAGPLQILFAVVGKGDHRAVDALLHAAGDEPHDALMPPAVVERHGRLAAPVDFRHVVLGVALHGVFQVSPLAIQVFELQRGALCFGGVVC